MLDFLDGANVSCNLAHRSWRSDSHFMIEFAAGCVVKRQ